MTYERIHNNNNVVFYLTIMNLFYAMLAIKYLSGTARYHNKNIKYIYMIFNLIKIGMWTCFVWNRKLIQYIHMVL
jgi:hypothetical protein